MARSAQLSRQTRETQVTVSLNLDGQGRVEAATGVPFFDHMLAAWARHALVDVTVHAQGDLAVDAHHTVEDVGLVLGQALAQCLGDRAGLRRYGQALLPMDDALVQVALDLSGRPYLAWEVEVADRMLGNFHTDLALEFWRALAMRAGLTLHVRRVAGQDPHHVLEAVWKGAGLALREAALRDPRIEGPLSTKGVLA